MNRVFVLPLLCLFVLPVGFAQQYYADITVTVEGDTARISGTSNHPELQPQTVSTSGNMLQLSVNETFQDYIFTIRIPDDAELTAVTTPANTRFYTEDGYLVVRGVATNEEFYVRASYTEPSSTSNTVLYAFLVTGLLAGLVWIYQWTEKFTPPKDVSDRQHDILMYLYENGPQTQQHLSEALDVPKSSVSRNIASLEKKGYVDKTKRGNSNTIRLSEEI